MLTFFDQVWNIVHGMAVLPLVLLEKKETASSVKVWGVN